MPLGISSERSSDLRRRVSSSAAMRARMKLSFTSRTLHHLHSERFKHFQVFIHGWIRRGKKFLSRKNGIGAGQKTKSDGLARKFVAATRQAHARDRHQNARRGNRAD